MYHILISCHTWFPCPLPLPDYLSISPPVPSSATKAAEKASRSDLFPDEEVPQGRSSWEPQDSVLTPEGGTVYATPGGAPNYQLGLPEYDKDLEENNHLNVVAAALHPQQLAASPMPRRQATRRWGGGEEAKMMHAGDPYGSETGAAYHESAADKKWQDYLFDQQMKGRYINSSARARRVRGRAQTSCVDVRCVRACAGSPGRFQARDRTVRGT